MALSEDQIAELKQQHGTRLQLEVFDGPEGDGSDDIDVVIKPPNGVAFRRFIDERNEGKLSSSTVLQNFVDAHVVYPPKEEFKKLADELSGIRVSLSVTLQTMAGAQGSRESKKL
jgi:hypothetical protein